MTKALRRRIIAVAMVSMLSVLAVIIAAANIAGYAQVRSNADRVLEVLVENGGVFDRIQDIPPMDDGELPEKKDGETDPAGKRPGGKNPAWFSAETPYETRFFFGTVTDDGVISVNTGSIAAVSEVEAKDFLLRAYGSRSEKGYITRYRYAKKAGEDGTFVVMVDCTRQLDTAASFLQYSILISLIGSCAVFLLVLLLSRAAVKPAEESYAKQKRFITDSGHELKTPLAVISANAEVLEAEYGENEWTRSIRHQVDRMAELTSRLTRLARMDEQAGDGVREALPLTALTRDSVSAFGAPAETAGKRLSAEIADGVWVMGDRENLLQLLSILLDNAVKYARGEIGVTLTRRAGRATLTVRNDVAEPVARGSLNCFFDRFWRGDASRSQATPGFGIGLSLAQSIVTSLGGSIRAESEDGMHVTVTVCLHTCEEGGGKKENPK